MNLKVEFLGKEVIERRALELLESYFGELGQTMCAPIPVDDILELHLGLTLDFDDLYEILGLVDVLGATWIGERKVFIDQTLDPHEHPTMEGRYNFTVGHEAGHWVLHRVQLSPADLQPVMFRHNEIANLVICRSSMRKQRIEWQADYFSSVLLMPKHLVLESWNDLFPSANGGPFIYNPMHWGELISRLERPCMRRVTHIVADIFEERPKAAMALFHKISMCLAPRFKVSAQAMQIRLEDMGLLKISNNANYQPWLQL